MVLVQDDVAAAQAGDPAALESLLRSVQDRVYRLALRMLGDPEDALDATQEILLRVARGLESFRGQSAFPTWVYRVACNHLLNTRKRRAEQRAEQAGLTFDTFAQMLDAGLAVAEQAAGAAAPPGVDTQLLEDEVKLGCTQSMLLCLDREHRLAFILADVLGLSGEEGAAVLEITPAAFRKRLSRARDRLRTFMTARCGLVHDQNPCRCALQVPFSLHAGLIDPQRLRYATHPVEDSVDAPADGAAQRATRELEELESITAVFRGHPTYAAPGALASAVAGLVRSSDYRILSD